MKKKLWKKSEDACLLAAISLLITFTFFIAGPIQLYISNISEFWFSLTDMLGVCLLTGLLVAIGIFLIGLILRGIPRTAYICLLLGLSIALYIQGNFVMTDYGILDGREIIWADYSFTAIWNTSLWIVCLVTPFIIWFCFREKIKTWFKYVAYALTLIQIISLGTLCLTTDLFNASNRNTLILSDRNLYSVSEEENVVTFVLDTFDQDYLLNILNDDPSFLDPLDGFTCFMNATSAYPTTKGSLPYLLTEQYYENEQPYVDYVDAAFANTSYYDVLKKAGYDINLYTNTPYVSSRTKRNYVSNTGGSMRINSQSKLEQALLQMTAFSYFPHIAKQFVWFYSGIFDELQASTVNDETPFSKANIDFYSGLVRDKLYTVANAKNYQFIHLSGAHLPHTLNEDVTIAENNEASSLTHTKACLNIVYEYIRQLKALGVYDQTMIIITADHGKSNFKAPILLIKRFSETGTLRYSSAPVSHANLHATVMESLGLNENNMFGTSAYDVSENSNVTRRYLDYSWNTDWWSAAYLPPMTEYYVQPEGNTKNSFLPTMKRYTEHGIDTSASLLYAYHPGDTVLFVLNSEGTNGADYFLYGLSGIETDSAWSSGYRSRIYLFIDGQSSDLIAEFTCKAIYSGSQHVTVMSGNETLFSDLVTRDQPVIRFTVPENCIQNGQLILDFMYPDARSPVEDGGRDSRVLALKYKQFMLTPVADQ